MNKIKYKLISIRILFDILFRKLDPLLLKYPYNKRAVRKVAFCVVIKHFGEDEQRIKSNIILFLDSLSKHLIPIDNYLLRSYLKKGGTYISWI